MDKNKNLTDSATAFSKRLLDTYHYKTSIEYTFSRKFIEQNNDLVKFRDKNAKTIESYQNKQLHKLSPKQRRVVDKEAEKFSSTLNTDNMITTNNELNFVGLWLEYEYYQKNFLVNFLLLNKDIFKKIVTLKAKKIKDEPSVDSVYWKHFFANKLSSEVEYDYVNLFIYKITKNSFDTQNLFKDIGVEISSFDYEIILCLQRLRNCIIHNKSILNEEDFNIISSLVSNKEHSKLYSKKMIKAKNNWNSNQKKEKDKIKKTKEIEAGGIFPCNFTRIYYFFKELQKELRANFIVNKEYSIILKPKQFDSIFFIIYRDFFNKTYLLLSKSDFDYDVENDSLVQLTNNNRLDCIDGIIFCYGDLFEKEKTACIKRAGKNFVQSVDEKFGHPLVLRIIKVSNLFDSMIQILEDNSLYDINTGEFELKANIRVQNRLRVNILALGYYNQSMMGRANDAGGSFNKNSILNDPIFSLIKHNENSELFDSDDKSINIDFKFAKHLLLNELKQAEETLYNCKDFNAENLNAINAWPLLYDFKKTDAFLNIQEAYGLIEKEDNYLNQLEITDKKVEA